MMLIPLIVVGGIIWLVVASSRGGWQHYGGQEPTPREILEKRYARGEITREQYLTMLDDLTKHS